MRILLIIPILLLVGCGASQPKPFTLNMSPEEIRQTDPLLLCLDQSKFDIAEVNTTINAKGIDCYPRLKNYYAKAAKASNNIDVCHMWAYSEDEIAREALQAEVSNRRLDCGSLLAAKAQQDNVIATQRAIDRLDDYRFRNCGHFGCNRHHYY